MTVRTARTDDLTPREVRDIRKLMDRAFADDEGFDEDDWQHALGGLHFIIHADGGIASHASVVPRQLLAGDVLLRAGYVEAVATDPRLQGRGFGTRIMEAVGAHISDSFEIGALGTGKFGFYERLGWRRWRGPTSVRTEHGRERTPDEDGYVMVLVTPASPTLDSHAELSCEWRPGDVW